MSLLRGHPAYPKDRDLSRVVQAAAARLVQKFDRLDPHSLGLSPEACSLICQRRESAKEEIERCAQVFAWALPRDEKPFSDLSLVAFADRLGLFALLARECNVGTVVCHNTEGADVDDARIIGKAIGSRADHYVFGDLEDLGFVMRYREIVCDVFVSRRGSDVVERLEKLFDAVCGLANGALSLGLGFEERGPLASAGPTAAGGAAARILRYGDELSAAGFQVSVIRGPSKGTLRALPGRVACFVERVLFHSHGRQAIAPRETPLILHGSRKARSAPHEQPRPSAPSPATSRVDRGGRSHNLSPTVWRTEDPTRVS
jgi:hypothetical protein